MHVFTTTTGLLLAGLLWLAMGPTADPAPAPDPAPKPIEDCVGCAKSHHAPEPIDEAAFRELCALFAGGDGDTADPAYETLLFHGARSRALLKRIGPGPLDAARFARLQRELERTHALLSVRVIDADGVTRLRLHDARARIGEKQHVHGDTKDLQPVEVSGTIYRVAHDRLWARF